MERDEVFQEDPTGRSPLALDQKTLLNEQFRVGRVLGMGGFGITYLAFDKVLEMVVAVKEYLPSNIAIRKSGSNTVQPLSSSDEESDFEFGLRRFLQEARTLAKFEAHPNIVRVRTFFRENGTGYLVMNFYEGRTLAEYLAARNGFLPEQEALLILKQVVEGLTAVHEQNILHRDIDPNNVYLADNGTVVLLDFGAARTAVGERTQSMSVVLKRGYAPHEQYHSHGDQGPWTDVYACSATLYRTLTGYKPPEAAARILDDDLVPPRELVPSLSGATDEAVEKGLELRPEDRPQTMEAFAALLPEPSSQAEPGWIGKMTTVEMATRAEGGSAELRLTSSHACRLYVDGRRTAELAPGEAYTLGVEPGTHRLRAVRIDQSGSGTAPATASWTAMSLRSGSQLSLDALVWQEVVSVTATDPRSVHVDFAKTTGREGAEMEASGERIESPATAQPRAERRKEFSSASTSPSATATLQVQADRSAHLFLDGDWETLLAPNEKVQIDLVPGRHRLRAEAADGPERWAQEIAVTSSGVRSVHIALDRTGASIFAVEPSDPSLRHVGIGAGVLVAILALGWWAFGNESPRPRPDRFLTTRQEVVVDVTANDRDPEREGVRVVAAGPVPDSVAQVTAPDSAHLRIRFAAGFAGTARVPYQVADAAGHTARSAVTLRVPFNGVQHVISDRIEQPQVVDIDSLGDDGDLDVVMASLGEPAVRWSENALEGDGAFRPPTAIESSLDGVVDVSTADLTGNGRVDILSASLKNDVVAWYENRGGGAFGEKHLLSMNANGAVAVRAADLDRDGDTDVIAGARLDETIAWYENRGNGQFEKESVVVEDVRGLETLDITDLDNDQVPDVLVVAYRDSIISRYEPQPLASDSLRFVERPPVGTRLDEPIEVHTADVVGDGLEDVLAGKVGRESLLLFENRSAGVNQPTFGNKRVLAPGLRTIEEIDTGDLDGDGDTDIFAASFESDRVVWFKNLGDGSFGPAQPIATNISDVISLTVADVDRDGDVDVLTASQSENTVGWYENHLR